MGMVSPEPNTGCWLWTGGDNGTGYGQFWFDGRGIYAHRFAYELWVGQIPAALQIDHLCRVRCCVNPAHLEAVTAKTNMRRGDTIARRFGDATRCVNGHDFTPDNTAWRTVPSGLGADGLARARARERARRYRRG